MCVGFFDAEFDADYSRNTILIDWHCVKCTGQQKNREFKNICVEIVAYLYHIVIYLKSTDLL